VPALAADENDIHVKEAVMEEVGLGSGKQRRRLCRIR
jgi:hypothetical protein